MTGTKDRWGSDRFIPAAELLAFKSDAQALAELTVAYLIHEVWMCVDVKPDRIYRFAVTVMEISEDSEKKEGETR